MSGSSGSSSFWRQAFGSPSFVIGLVISAIAIGIALTSIAWTPADIAQQNIAARFGSADAQHWLGTDQYGRDFLSRLMVGMRNSLLVALVAVAIGVGIGVPLGALAAAKSGFADDAVMRVNDFVFAFPSLLIAILITARYGPGAVNSIIAIGIFNIPVFARVTRGGAKVIWQRQFVAAAQVMGKGWARISFEHVLPNILSLLIVQMTIQLALGILADAGLSYLGLAVQPPAPTLGKMLRDAQTLTLLAPQLAIIPGCLIIVTVLGLNLLGDGLRDVLDPRLRKVRE